MEVTILFRGIRGQILFYDERDRGRFVHVCSLLPSQGEIAATGWQAMWRRIQANIAKARAGGLKK